MLYSFSICIHAYLLYIRESRLLVLPLTNNVCPRSIPALLRPSNRRGFQSRQDSYVSLIDTPCAQLTHLYNRRSRFTQQQRGPYLPETRCGMDSQGYSCRGTFFLSCLIMIIVLTRRHAHLSTTSSSLPSHGLPIRTVSSPAPRTVMPTSGLLPSLDGSPPSSCSVSTVPRHVSSGVPTKTSLLSEAVREQLQSVTLMRRTIGGYQNMSRSL